MSTRIPVSWIVLFVVISAFAFFGYHILQASGTKESGLEESMRIHSLPGTAQSLVQPVTPMQSYEYDEQPDIGSAPGSAAHHRPAVANRMPSVPAQTEDDLRAMKSHMMTPPPVQYDSPEATDPLNRTVHMNAEFGSNLRHPEQMIEQHPGIGMGSVVASGLGSEYSSPGGNRAAGYAPEMVQNSGEYMEGITAYDVSDNGTGFSLF